MTARRHPWQASLRRLVGDEGGSALIIALVMVFVISLIATAVLSYTGTSLSASKTVASDRKSLYAADGAIDTAIRRLADVSNNAQCGTGPTAVGANDAPTVSVLDVTAAGGQPATHVDCTRENPGSVTGDGGSNSNAPANAVLTLGQRANQPPPSQITDACGIFWWSRPDRTDNVVEPGVYFQPSANVVDLFQMLFSCGFTGYKQSDVVRVAGGVVSNSTVVGKADSQLNVAGAIKVRQACAFTGAGNIVSTRGTGTDPATGACDVQSYASTDAAFADPNYPSRAQLPTATDSRGNQISGLPDKPVYANNPTSPNVPACGTSTLVTFKPGWYDNSETLNNLFRTCANADGSGKDYWFMPGVYYFDFRNTSVTQGCGNVGIDADPGVFDFGDENLDALTHQWCIRGQNVSDGNQTTTAQKRPHIVGGTPFGTAETGNGGLQCAAGAEYCWNPMPDPVTALLQAATASSTDFTNPNNAKAVDGTSASASWAGATTTQTNGTAASSQVVTAGTDDFTPKANATGAINGTLATHTLASVSSAVTAAAAASTQVTVAGTDDFANPGNGRVIGGSSTSAPVASQTQTVTNGSAASTQVAVPGTDDFANKANATGVIDGTLAGHTLASVTSALTAASAASSQISGSNDFANPGNGRTIGDAATTSATVANQSTTSNLANAASTQVATSGTDDFANKANATGAIDGTFASHTLASVTAAITAAAASSTQVENPGTDDFTNPGNGRTIGDSATTSETIASASQNIGAGSAASTQVAAAGVDDFANTNNATGAIDGTFAAHTLASVTSTLTAATAVSSQASGSDDFVNPGNGRTIGDSQTTSGTIASQSLTQTYSSVVTSQVSGGPDFTPIGNASTIDGSTASHTLATGAGVMNPSVATSTQATPGTDDFANKNNATGATGSGDATAATATWNVNPTTTTLSPASGHDAPDAGNVAFSNQTQAYVLDNGGDGTAASYAGTGHAQLILTGYPDIPTTAVPTVATITIRHKESTSNSGNVALLEANILDGADNPLCTADIKAGNDLQSGSYRTDTYTLPASCLSTAALVNGFKVSYEGQSSSSTSRTFWLDGITLSVTYRIPRTLSLATATPQIANPANTQVTAVSIQLRHTESNGGTQQLVITPGGGAACAPIAITRRSSATTDTFAVPAGCLDTAARVNGATYAYTATSPGGGSFSASVYGLEVGVTYDTSNRTVTYTTPFNPVPAGGVVDTAVLSIAHRETGSNANPRIIVTPGGGGTCTFPLTTRAALTTDTVNVRTGCLDTGAKLNGATVQYVVNLTSSSSAQSATTYVDGASIAVGYTDTTVRTVTLSGLAPTVAGTVDTVSVSIAHQETGAGLNPRLLITQGGGNGVCTTISLPTRAALTTDLATLSGGCLNSAAKINGATLQYLVGLTDAGGGSPQSGTATLDGAKIDVVATDGTTRSLTLTSPAPAVPPAATIDTVTVSIAHQETATGSNPRIVITPGGQAACSAVTLPTRTVMTTDTVTLPGGCTLNTPARVNGASFQYQVNLTPNGTAQSITSRVDAVRMAVVSTSTTARAVTLSSVDGSALPGSVTPESVVLSVAHQETGSGLSPRLVITQGGGNGVCTTINLTTRASLTTDTPALPSGCLNSAAKINGATIQYVVNLTDNGAVQSGVATLDGMRIDWLSTNTTARTLTLSNPTPNVPAGTFDSVAVSIAHQETGSGVSPTLVITPGGGSACSAIALTPRSTMTTDTVSVPAGCLDTIAKINGATFQYQTRLTANGTAQSGVARVDAVRIVTLSTDTTPEWVTLSSLGPAVSGTIDTVSLSVAHQETGSGLSPRIVVTPGGGSACTAVNLATRATLTTDLVTLPAGCLNTAAKANGATVQYLVNLTANGSAQSGVATLDGARLDVTATDTATRTLTLSNPAPTVPAGSTFDSVSMTITHQETASGANPRLVITPGGGSACTTVNLTTRTSLTTDSVAIPSGCLNTAAKINGATFQYQVNLTATGTAQSVTARVDALQMTVVTTNVANRAVTLSSVDGSALPGSVTPESVVLSVAHQETGSGLSPRLVITQGGGNGVCTTINLTTRASLTTDTPALPSGCLNSAAKINGATIQYVVNLTDNGAVQSGVATLDGMRIDWLSTNTTARTLTLSSPSPAVPTTAGNAINNATLSIAHQETGSAVSPTLVITPGGASACAAIALTPQATLTTDAIDVTSCLNTPVKANGATYQYQARLTANGTAQSAVASIDGASIVVRSTVGGTKTLNLGGFGGTVPAANTITSATLTIAHDESSGVTSQAVLTPGGSGACAATPVPAHATTTTDTIDVTSCLNTPAKVNGVAFQYLANPPGGASVTANLDGATLTVVHQPAPGRAPVLGAANNKFSASDPDPTRRNASRPACDETKPGVQWVFGGDSRIYQPDGTVELCAGPSPGVPGQNGYTAQRIAVYGVAPTPTMKPTTVTDAAGVFTTPTDALAIGEAPSLKTAMLAGPAGPVTLTPATLATSSQTAAVDDWMNKNNALNIAGASPATSQLTTTKTTSNLTLGGYPTIPTTAVPTAASVTVKHQVDNSSSTSANLVVIPGDGSAPCNAVGLTTSQTNGFSQTVNLPSSCLNTAAKVNGAQMKYTANRTSGTRNFSLSGMSLTVTYNVTGALTLNGFTGTTIPNGMKVKSVVARVSHTETYANGGTNFNSNPAPTASFTNGLGQSCGTATNLGLFQRNFWDFLNIFSRAQDGPVAEEIDLTSCFNDAGTSAQQLSGASATFSGLAKPTQQESLDGIELVVTLQPSTASTNVLMPQSGCVTIQPKYDNGYGSVSHIGLDTRAGDCAVWKWDSAEYRRTFFGFTTGNVSGSANAQTSIRGTVYTPGAAVDVDDQGARTTTNQTVGQSCSSSSGTTVGSGCYTGVNYPLFGRGIISRHLRFKGFKLAPNYTQSTILCEGAACNGGTTSVLQRDVRLEACVGTGGAPVSCGGAWKKRVTAWVTFSGSVDPATNLFPTTVTQWTVD